MEERNSLEERRTNPFALARFNFLAIILFGCAYFGIGLISLKAGFSIVTLAVMTLGLATIYPAKVQRYADYSAGRVIARLLVLATCFPITFGLFYLGGAFPLGSQGYLWLGFASFVLAVFNTVLAETFGEFIQLKH